MAGIANSTNFLIGDAGRDIRDHAVGGDDTFTGGANSINTFVGDAGRNASSTMHLGGKDTFTDLAFTDSAFYGDALATCPGVRSAVMTQRMPPRPRRSQPHVTFYGDAGANMSDHAAGGA